MRAFDDEFTAVTRTGPEAETSSCLSCRVGAPTTELEQKYDVYRKRHNQ